MTTFKIVNFVVGTIVILIFLCGSCLSKDVTQNVRFIVQSSENHDQEQEQNVISPKIFSYIKWLQANILSDTTKNQESSAEVGIRWDSSKNKGNLLALKNKERVIRQVNNGYSNIYPTLPTQYPHTQMNFAPYRPSAPPYDEPSPNNNFNNYPVPNRNYFPNTTSRYPPNNPISSRPPYYPPKQNWNYGNSTYLNQNLNQYNRTSYTNANNFSSQTGQQNGYNNFPVNNQNYFSNTSPRYPQNNPLSSRPPYYPSNQNLNNANKPPFNQYPNQNNRSSSSYPNHFSSQNNATYQQNTHFPQNTQTGSRQPNYFPSFVPNNNYTQGRNQFINNNNRYNQYPSNYNPNFYSTNGQQPQWSNRNVSNSSGYGSNSYQHNTQQISGFNPGNGFTSSGSQSRWPGYPVNNGNYINQSPYLATNSTFKPAFYDNSKYNNPNQNNYVEPSHFFFNPGQKPRY